MRRFFVSKEEMNSLSIFGEEYNHIKNVLRMNKGDSFIAFINDEKDYNCTITDITKKEVKFVVNSASINTANPTIKIDAFQALAKGEKMELVSQKLTEIGVSTIFPLFVKNCDVKQNSTKPTRLKKILTSACGQCGRSIVPFIGDTVSLKEMLKLLPCYDLCLFANEREDEARIYDILNKNPNATRIAYIIGPEGGFSPEEIDEIKKHATSVSLGKRILRTETAAIYIISILNDFYRN